MTSSHGRTTESHAGEACVSGSPIEVALRFVAALRRQDLEEASALMTPRMRELIDRSPPIEPLVGKDASTDDGPMWASFQMTWTDEGWRVDLVAAPPALDPSSMQ